MAAVELRSVLSTRHHSIMTPSGSVLPTHHHSIMTPPGSMCSMIMGGRVATDLSCHHLRDSYAHALVIHPNNPPAAVESIVYLCGISLSQRLPCQSPPLHRVHQA